VAAEELVAALSAAGRSPEAARSVLDFGCGAGRVLPWVSALATPSDCTGCDVDRFAIRWAQDNRPGPRWTVSSFAPPLPFADDSFDLIYSISVFSHLGGSWQNPWLREIGRVLAPDGVALLSVHGPHAFDAFRSGRARTGWCSAEAFARGPLGEAEFVFAPYVRSVWNSGELPGIGPAYGLAFHGPGHVHRSWDGALEVVEILERGLTGWQDVVVCRKRRGP
jgi:SAM-dependent methyltransferase